MGVDTGRVPGMATLDSTGLRAADHAYQRSYHALRRRAATPVPDRPQAFMGNHARVYSAELWDNGITAGLINYNFTGNNAP